MGSEGDEAQQAGDTSRDRNCPGCGAGARSGEFCSACGERLQHRRPSARELVLETVGGLTSWDHALGRTLTGLWRDPGGFTDAWLAGDRKRHVGPSRLLVWSVAFYVLLFAAGGLSVLETSGIKITRTEPRTAADADSGSDAVAETGEGVGLEEGGDTAQRFLRVASETKRLASRWIQPLLLLALPLQAGLVHLLYRRRGRTFVDCLVLVAYVEASLFFLYGLLVPGYLLSPNDAELARLILTVVWGTRAARRFFGVSVGSALWRELAVRVLHMLLTALLFALLLIPIAWIRTG